MWCWWGCVSKVVVGEDDDDEGVENRLQFRPMIVAMADPQFPDPTIQTLSMTGPSSLSSTISEFREEPPIIVVVGKVRYWILNHIVLASRY